MKRILGVLLLISSSLLGQQWDDELFQIENSPPPSYPFTVSGSYLDVDKASFRTPGLENSNLKYAQWETALAYTHPFTEYCGLIFGAGWVGTEVAMKNNPEFHETIFNYINFSAGAYTNAFPDWTWTLTIAAFLDLEELSLFDYALYQGVLWGRYAACKFVELDFGLIIEAGLKKEKVWPILGFAYKPWDCLHLNVIYPINISIDYLMTKKITVSASIRFLRNRHRVKEDEPNSQGIFEYETAGGEFDLSYRPFQWVSLKGFAGSTFNGDLKISDRNDHNSIHYKFKGSFYAGASAFVSF